LDQVLTEEVASKTAKHVTMRTHLARFPFVKGLDAFDFIYQPSLDKKQVQTLASCHFVEHGQNLVIRGPPGVGKSHLAVGLGLKAIEHGYRGFSPRPPRLSPPSPAGTGDRLDEKLKLYTAPVCSSSMRSGTCPDGGYDPE
jgi:IstB-like ATP binding protein